jgi:hypothetical protein
MMKFILVKKEVSKKNIFNPISKINKGQFVELVERSDWLTWHEFTEWGKELYIKQPNYPKKIQADYNLEKGIWLDIYYFDVGYCMVTFEQDFSYKRFKLIWDFANDLDCNVWERYKSILITENYLEALRIKEENRGIKLTKEQSHVLSSVEDQCRWWYIPTDDVSAVFTIFGLQPDLKEADITEIIDDVQFENKIVVASFTGHTILFGFNAPYIAYPNLNAYTDIKDQHTPHLQNTLNKLSKAFGTAAYFEYNNDDEMIASLAWSTKGKFVYGRFTSEGEGMDVYGTQKKAMEVNQKSILKTAKKLGMTPEDILTGMMKQKQKVRFFTQKNWFIEEKLKR